MNTVGAFNIIIFDEKMILEQDVSEWPIVQCYVSFHSKGFPLYKSLEYVKMRHPVEINKVGHVKGNICICFPNLQCENLYTPRG